MEPASVFVAMAEIKKKRRKIKAEKNIWNAVSCGQSLFQLHLSNICNDLSSKWPLHPAAQIFKGKVININPVIVFTHSAFTNKAAALFKMCLLLLQFIVYYFRVT